MRSPITYIFTDIHQECRNICETLGIKMMGSALPRSSNTIWINYIDMIYGRILKKEDTFIWGRFNDLELWHRLQCEVKIRLHCESIKEKSSES